MHYETTVSVEGKCLQRLVEDRYVNGQIQTFILGNWEPCNSKNLGGRTGRPNPAVNHSDGVAYSASKRLSVHYAGPDGPMPAPENNGLTVGQEASLKTFFFMAAVVAVLVFVVNKL